MVVTHRGGAGCSLSLLYVRLNKPPIVIERKATEVISLINISYINSFNTYGWKTICIFKFSKMIDLYSQSISLMQLKNIRPEIQGKKQTPE